ncbi:MAG: alanine--tRNA ligase [Candidatus Borkfalkiaceae bacterium]|nr:alanine--tRNA ligase [Christensenellaceae bacterium]
MFTSKQLREKWLNFYIERGHVNIGAVSLIGDGTTGVMFNVAGMQPLMPYLLGKKHPSGKTRLCNVQGCVRTVDIDSVGDATHFTFFEMMGNWSLGDYFKKEKTKWTFEFLTEVLGFDKEKICSTVFEGNDAVKKDTETAELLKSLGIKEENIFFLPKKDNWWELEGTVNTPCGPDNEWFYPREDGKDSSDFLTGNRYVEIGNDVYMQYKKKEGGKYEELEHKNVDTGFGLDRLLVFLNGLDDGYKTDLFDDAIKYLEKVSGLSYDNDEKARKAMRIIADHTRTATMLIGDANGITPSNTGAGYILRRLLRRAIRYCKNINIDAEKMCEVSKIFIEKVYDEAYPILLQKESYILEEITKEIKKFEATLSTGMKEFDKCIVGIERKNQFMSQKDSSYVPETVISGKQAFRLYDTYGFPLELTSELAAEKGMTVDAEGFNEAFKAHQELSKAQAQAAKGGLTERNEITARYHTATHIMLAGLRKMFGDKTEQKGSNITEDRMRFDFNCDHKMTEEELKELQDFVNDVIARNIPVEREEIPYNKAVETGAYGVFHATGDDQIVTVYTIGDVDRQICGGPHAKTTGELGKFEITKEESSSSGVRRIKAVLKF